MTTSDYPDKPQQVKKKKLVRKKLANRIIATGNKGGSAFVRDGMIYLNPSD